MSAPLPFEYNMSSWFTFDEYKLSEIGYVW